jgi:hypothetical protein
VLARELPRERGVDRGVRVKDLDAVERDPLPENPPERFAQLVLLPDRAEEARPPRDARPLLRRIDGKLAEPVSREPLQEPALDVGDLRVGGEEIHGGPADGARRRPPQHLEAVDEASLGEELSVARENGADLFRLSRVGERRGRDRTRLEARAAQLVEGLLERAMEARPVAQAPEVGAGSEGLGARLLDQREGLGAREQPEPAVRELGPDRSERERPEGLDAQVHRRVALPRQPLDERVADRERRRDEDLLLDGELRADPSQLLDQPRGLLRRTGGGRSAERRGRRGMRRRSRRLGRPRRGGLVEREEGLFRHGRSPFLRSRRTDSVRASDPGSTLSGGVDSLRKRGSPLRGGASVRRERLRVRRATAWRTGDPANLMRVMPP